jgi:hypothetical protein
VFSLDTPHKCTLSAENMSEKSDSELNDELHPECDLRKLLTTAIAELIPLHVDANGVIRVSGTHVPLDTLVSAFSEGATAEEITQQYPR